MSPRYLAPPLPASASFPANPSLPTPPLSPPPPTQLATLATSGQISPATKFTELSEMSAPPRHYVSYQLPVINGPCSSCSL
jgi:hypothetical protein